MPKMSASNFGSLCGYFMSCDAPLSNVGELSIWRVFSQVSKIFELYFKSCQREKFVNIVVQPSSFLLEHQLQPSSSFDATIVTAIFSTSNYQKTRVESDINIDYKASSFDRLCIWRRKWETVGLVRELQRKYWNALIVGRGHADDGCSCNHRVVSPSVLSFTYYILAFQ